MASANPWDKALQFADRKDHASSTVYQAVREAREATLKLVAALEEIADADYRGNRSPESERAHRALVAEGLRA
jgi:plasmid stabilization system protein ParE